MPATIVNWGGDEETSIEEWCEYIGRPRRYATCASTSPTHTIGGIPTDNTKRLDARGSDDRVGWKDGMRRMVETRVGGATS